MTHAATALRWSGGVLGAVVVLAAALQTADHLAQRTTATSHAYPAAAWVELVADGDVTVSTGGTEVVASATARTGFAPATYSADETDGHLVIRHQCRDVVAASCTASLAVQVPEGSHVTVRASAGAVSAVGVVGDVDAQAGVGDVVVQDVTGRVRATSDAGTVEVRRVRGPVDASTTVGAVAVSDVEGDTVAEAGSGPVEVAGVLGDVRATTGTGTVVVRSAGAPVALDIATATGRTRIDAPTDPAARRSVVIRSGAGDVSYVGADPTG